MLSHLPLTFQHRAGVRPYTSFYNFAEPYVFSKQSLPPILCPRTLVAQCAGLLIPKLRRHFAEFLQYRSLKRLGILYLPTCVGFGYGLNSGVISWNTYAASTNPIRGYDYQHSSLPEGTGILTCFPSATAFALTLGADSPCAD